MQKPTIADARVVEAGVVQVRRRAASTSMRIPGSVSPSNSGQHLVEVVVGRGASTGAVEQRRRDGVVAGVGEPAGDVLDVVVHPERLLDHDHRPAGSAIRHRLVGRHRPVGGLQGQVVDLHARVATTPTLVAPADRPCQRRAPTLTS